jgi:sortase (surface protein transpeptidase)
VLVSALRKIAFGAVVLEVALAGHGAVLGQARIGPPIGAPPVRDSATDQRNSDPFVWAPPVRLQIPSLNVDAQVEALGIDSLGVLETPNNIWNVGWYKGGPSPGASGDAVIDGHVGLPGSPLVFSGLSRIALGADLIAVHADGTRSRFTVSSIRNWPSASQPTGLFTADGQARLSLITCTGKYDGGSQTYAERLIVEATYAGVA